MTKKGKRTVSIYQLKNEYKAIGYLKANLTLFNPRASLSFGEGFARQASNMLDPYPQPIEEGVNIQCYEHVYDWQCSIIAHSAILSGAFSRFNEDKKPASYKGVSMSVSDIVVIDGQAYICAPLGWAQVELLDGANAPIAE